MNIDKFDTWQYREDRNCWDYVREFLIERAGIPKEDAPVYGICPDDKRAMTKAARKLKKGFLLSGPVDYSIACHYHVDTILHVGVVYNGEVWHTGSEIGTRRNTIKEFEAMAMRTEYRLHRSLWHS